MARGQMTVGLPRSCVGGSRAWSIALKRMKSGVAPPAFAYLLCRRRIQKAGEFQIEHLQASLVELTELLFQLCDPASDVFKGFLFRYDKCNFKICCELRFDGGAFVARACHALLSHPPLQRSVRK